MATCDMGATMDAIPPVIGPADDSAAVFVGRSAELDHLHASAKRVMAGHPRTIWVEGAAGIGKTSLLDTFVAGLGGFTVLSAAGDPTETLLPFGALEQFVSGTDGQLAQWTRNRPTPGTSPADAGAWLLDLLGELQNTGPVAIVVDDVQWADLPSAQALGFALRRLAADRVLALISMRVPARDADVRALTGYLMRNRVETTTLTLGGLSVRDIQSLSVLLTGEDLPLPAATRLREHTDGNPFHVSSLLTEVDQRLLAEATDTLPVPRSLLAAIGQAVRRLPPESRRLVDALAVLGGRYPLARVAQLARVDNPALALGPALEAGVVQWWPADPTNQVVMAHALYRDAVYELLSPAWRAQLHATAASLVDHSSSWAHRVAATSVADNALAAELEQEAGNMAEATHHDVAARYLRWAAELSESRAEYERRFLAACVHMTLTSNRTWVLGRRAEIESCRASPLRDCALAMVLVFGVGDLPAAEVLLLQAVYAEENWDWVRGTAATELAALHLWRGRGAQVLDATAIALVTPGTPRRLRDFTHVLRAVAKSRMTGPRTGLTELAHLPSRADQVPAADVESLACRGLLHVMLGEYTEAIDDLTVVLGMPQLQDGIMAGCAPYAYLAASRYELGKWNDAVITADQAVAAQEAYPRTENHALASMVAALVPAARGEFTTAAPHAEAARRHAETIGTPQDLRYAAIAGALLARARDDLDAMLAAVRLVDRTATQLAYEWWDAWWRPLLVEALLAAGELDEAEHELRVFEQSATDMRHTSDTPARLRAGLAVRKGAPEEALEIYQAATRDPAGPRLPLATAMLEHEHGRLLLSTGYRTDARARLAQSYRRFARLGAWPYARRAEEDLRLCDPRAAPGASGLTGREEQVSNLLARGLTNREIANELYITTKTVEYHLGNVYAKLGVTSRQEFKRLLEQP